MKKLVFVNLIMIFLISCKSNHSDPMTTKNTALVETYFQLFNNHDWDKLSQLYSENADFKDPSLGSGVVKQSRKQFIDKYAQLNEIFPDLRDDIVAIYPSGENNVIVEFISRGTAEDKSTFELPICTIFTIENGVIVKDYTYYDNFDESQ